LTPASYSLPAIMCKHSCSKQMRSGGAGGYQEKLGSSSYVLNARRAKFLLLRSLAQSARVRYSPMTSQAKS
jgi:hypothetical protein